MLMMRSTSTRMIDTDGSNESLYEIEVRLVTRFGDKKEKLITLVAWSKREVADESGNRKAD